MKLMKRTMALLLGLLMVLAFGVTALADGATAYTISTAAGDTHTYSVYQILTGDLSSDGGTLSNVVAGKNFKTANGQGAGGTDLTAAEAAEALAAISATTDSGKLAKIEKYVVLTGEAYGIVSASSSLTRVPAGYYLIKDKDDLSGKDDAYTTYIVKVVNNVEITRKATKPTVEKKVKDTNDSKADSTTGWQDSADYDVNDRVPFQLTATLPSSATDFASYSKYKLIFHDVQSAGLTFDSSSVVVKYGDTTLASDQYTVTSSGLEDGCTFEVTIADVKSVKDASGNAITVAAGGKFYVEYNATLNENAVIGSTGNPNEVYLEYSNNPNAGGEGSTGETPKDKVIVFTYKVVVNKVDSQNQPLAGAKFTLYKKDAEGTYVQVGNEIEATAVYDEDGTTVESYTSEFLRVDDGDYKLVETTVPDGYNKCADVEFTITATHDETSDDPTLLTLTGGDKFSGNVSTGALTGRIENKKGAELPSTGGMGTTLFYVVGTVLMLGAAVLLITRRRVDAK